MLLTGANGRCDNPRMTYMETNHTPSDPQSPEATSRDRFESELLQEIPHLQNYALSLTRNSSEACDLVQDCVLRALENWHRFQEGTHLRRWLFTILRNRHLDGCRRRTRRGASIPIEDCRSPNLSQPASQEDWVELRECQRRLNEVRPCDRKILLLSVFSSLSHSEIADEMDIAEGTVRSRLCRTRAQLRGH